MSRAQASASAVVRNILDGTEEIVCHRGTHQYSDGGIFGVSACGLAALNFARIIFEKERECGRAEGLLQAIIAKETVQVSFCSVLLRPICLSSHPLHRILQTYVQVGAATCILTSRISVEFLCSIRHCNSLQQSMVGLIWISLQFYCSELATSNGPNICAPQMLILFFLFLQRITRHPYWRSGNNYTAPRNHCMFKARHP
jgi:hypothetical protein